MNSFKHYFLQFFYNFDIGDELLGASLMLLSRNKYGELCCLSAIKQLCFVEVFKL